MKFKKPQYEHYPTKAVEGAMAEKKATKEKAAAEKAETNRILHLYLRATEGEPAKKRLAKLLEKRLKKRGYDKQKIKDNLEAEIFDTSLDEAYRNKHNIIVIIIIY